MLPQGGKRVSAQTTLQLTSWADVWQHSAAPVSPPPPWRSWWAARLCWAAGSWPCGTGGRQGRGGARTGSKGWAVRTTQQACMPPTPDQHAGMGCAVSKSKQPVGRSLSLASSNTSSGGAEEPLSQRTIWARRLVAGTLQGRARRWGPGWEMTIAKHHNDRCHTQHAAAKADIQRAVAVARTACGSALAAPLAAWHPHHRSWPSWRPGPR